MQKSPLRIAITATPSQPRSAPLLFCGDVPGAFQQAVEEGCQGVEIHLRQAGDIDLNLVKRLMAETGLGVPTLGTGMAAVVDGLTFADPRPEIRAAAVERIRGHIGLAAEIGSAVTVGSMAGRLGSWDPDERRKLRARFIESLAEVCEIARQSGVTVLLEPLNRYESDYINTLADGRQVAAEVAAPNLALLADTFHMNIEEADLASSLRAEGRLIGHIHLVDTNRRVPGHGHMDLGSVLAALQEIGYPGYVSFEALPLPEPVQAMRDGVRATHAAWDQAVTHTRKESSS